MPSLSEPAGPLPHRPPRIGELVEVRSRRWLVETVEEADLGASPRVSLACADDDAQGQTLEVYWDFEIDRRILVQPVAARWVEPTRRGGPLKAYAEEAEARTLERLEDALQDARAPGHTIHRRLLDTAARDIEDLLPQLEERAEAVARTAADRLRERGEREERQLRETLEGQRRRVEAELRKQEAGGVQFALEFSESEKRQRQADIASWRTRLTQFDRDLKTEPARIREFFEVQTKRVEPIGLVYLWPDTG